MVVSSSGDVEMPVGLIDCSELSAGGGVAVLVIAGHWVLGYLQNGLRYLFYTHVPLSLPPPSVPWSTRPDEEQSKSLPCCADYSLTKADYLNPPGVLATWRPTTAWILHEGL